MSWYCASCGQERNLDDFGERCACGGQAIQTNADPIRDGDRITGFSFNPEGLDAQARLRASIDGDDVIVTATPTVVLESWGKTPIGPPVCDVCGREIEVVATPKGMLDSMFGFPPESVVRCGCGTGIVRDSVLTDRPIRSADE